MPGTGGDQPGQVPQCVAGLVLGQVDPVGGPAARSLARVGLDQYPLLVELDQLTVGAGIQVLAEELLGQRVERLGDLDVEVAVHLHAGEDRHVVGVRDRHQDRRLVFEEHLKRASVDGAVQAHPGSLGAPAGRGDLGLLKVGERLTGPEVAAHVLHGPLHARLVLRAAYPRGDGGRTRRAGRSRASPGSGEG